MNEKGQSLLEIAVTIGVIVIIVTGLAITTINGLKNSQFSKNQVQATKLAEDTIQKPKTIKTRDLAVCGPATATKWSDIWASVCPADSPCRYILKENPSSMVCSGPDSPFWLESQPALPDITSIIFERQIVVEDYATDQKKVTVIIKWVDTAGSHQSQLVTVLAKY